MKNRSRFMGNLCVSLLTGLSLTSPMALLANDVLENKGTVVCSDYVAENAKKEALQQLNAYATTMYQSEYFDTEMNIADDFVLGEGFYQYFDRNGQLDKSEVITFPVYQNNKPVFTIDVVNGNGKWSSSAGTGLVDELSKALNAPGTYMAKLYEEDGVMVIERVEESEVPASIHEVPVSAKANLPENTEVENDIYNILNPVSTYGIGFSTDLPNHKEIRMDNCIVIQPRQNGQVLGLCWASSAGTIIRQQTGNRTIDAWQIANEMGIAPGTGVGIETSRQVMINHGCTTQYQPVGRPANNYTEVMHNVNNQYPIYMECMSYSGGVGHAVTLTGYDNSASQLCLQYFDGAENGFRTTTYQGYSTQIASFGAAYYWNRSILIPLS